MENNGALTAKAISEGLTHPHTVEVFTQIDSTSSYLKRSAPNHGALVCALSQSAGRGRHTKSFYSPAGAGVYFSLCICRPIPIDSLWAITFMAALAVLRTLKKAGATPAIKWVNDIYLGEKKVCGILTEIDLENKRSVSSRVIVGIGLNIKKSKLPEELTHVATSLEEHAVTLDHAEAVRGIVNELDDLLDTFDIPSVVREYKENCFMLGRKISFCRDGREYQGIATDILPDGNLKVKTEEEEIILSSGEISVKPII